MPISDHCQKTTHMFQQPIQFAMAVLIALSVGFYIGGKRKGVPAAISTAQPNDKENAQVEPKAHPTEPIPQSQTQPQTQNPMSLQQQLSRMKYVELQRMCDEAAKDWRKRSLENHAPGPRDGAEAEVYRKTVLETLREPLRKVTYFRGQTTFSVGSRQIQLDIFLNFYNGKDPLETRSKRSQLNFTDPMDVCYDISPVYLVNGRRVRQGTTSMGTCSATLQKHGDSYYIPWFTVADDPELSSAISLVLIPIPNSKTSEIEYLVTETDGWQQSSFSWSATTEKDRDESLARYNKMYAEQVH